MPTSARKKRDDAGTAPTYLFIFKENITICIMFYYFYSENGDLKGLLNYKRMKIHLFSDMKQAVDYAVEQHGVTRENPMGYIYKCAQIKGEYFNNAYKSEHPLQIIGCVALREII